MSEPITESKTFDNISVTAGETTTTYYNGQLKVNIDIEDDMHKWTIEYIYRINDGGLVFDGGIANDGPGYYFKKQLSNAK